MLLPVLLIVAGVAAFLFAANDGAGVGCALVGAFLVLIGLVGFLMTAAGLM